MKFRRIAENSNSVTVPAWRPITVRGTRKAKERLAATDEASLVLHHVGQINVFLVPGYVAPGGFAGPDGTPDLDRLRAALRERVDALAPLRRVPGGGYHPPITTKNDLSAVPDECLTEEIFWASGYVAE